MDDTHQVGSISSGNRQRQSKMAVVRRKKRTKSESPSVVGVRIVRGENVDTRLPVIAHL